MSLAIAARFARRELRGGLRGFYIFLACLSLGVAAIAAVGTVRSSIGAGLAREGAALLGGDAEAQFTYRFAREDERAFLESISERVSEVVDFRSMAVVGEGQTAERGLTQVQAVDDLYPLIGSVTLAPDMPLADALDGDDTRPGGVMERVLVDRLGLSVGETFKLGTQEFVLSAILERYPDNSSAGFGLGPRTIVRTTALENSGLISEGTLFDTEYRLDLPDGADLDALEAQVDTQFEGEGVRWRDARRGAGSTARFVDRIGSFLILVGLSGLAVGGVGVSAAVRAYLQGKTGVIATLKTLGATRRTVFLTYAFQIGALTILGIVIGLILGAAIPLLLAPLISANLPIPAEFGLYPAPLIEATIYGILTAAIFTLWPLARTEDIRAATLFRDAMESGRALPRVPALLTTGALIAVLLATAVLFSGTARLTLWTAAGIAGALIALMLSAIFLRRLAKYAMKFSRGRPALRLAFGSISAKGSEATSIVLSLGLGLSVLAAVGQIDGNLRQAFDDELPDVAPSYFFVDIQPDQIDGFMERVKGDPQVSKVESAPMLRAMVTQINGRPAEEVAGGHWVVRGDRGITYADALPEGTIVTRGEWWPEGYSGEPQLSFSEEEALEIGLNLGDTVTVNVLGREITATITSFRKVEFQTGGMGFVMLFNANALAGAPHSWISTVYAEEEAEAQILRDLASAYPNITAIRIRDAIDQAMVLVEGIASGVRYGALATLVTGFLVLIGAASAGQQARTYESAVLKTIGATRSRILKSFALRAALVGAAAGLVALAAGTTGGWAVTHFVMESDYSVIWSNALWIILGGIGATLLANIGFALRALRAKPAQVLRARE